MDALAEQMGSRLFGEWMAFYRLEPRGEERADLRAALMTAFLFNIQVEKKDRKDVEEFMLRFDLTPGPSPLNGEGRDLTPGASPLTGEGRDLTPGPSPLNGKGRDLTPGPSPLNGEGGEDWRGMLAKVEMLNAAFGGEDLRASPDPHPASPIVINGGGGR